MDHKGAKFAYAVAKNVKILEPEAEPIIKALKFSKEYEEYDNARMESVKKYGKRDENKRLVIIENEYVILDQEKFDKELEPLQKKFAKAIKERKKQLEDLEKIMEGDVKVKLYKVALKDVPNDITTPQLLSIYDIIDDD